jgi:oligopeptide/dipeptide ABC transporter ATP-binding protein
MSALTITDLSIDFPTTKGVVHAVSDLSLSVGRGRRVGFIGESGSGKTTTALAVMQMLAEPGRVAGGQIDLGGTDILALSEDEMRRTRLSRVAYIPQGAMNSLNPVMKVRKQISDAIITHEGRQPKDTLKQRILDLFSLVGLPPRVYDLYPHELSGGMKQRVCIAMAIALNPPLIIADEPTSALDVVVQRVVAQTLLDVKNRLGVSMLMIGHDMGLQAQMVDRIIIMYAGNIVEIAPVEGAFDTPLHPYTQLLIESIPSIKERKPLHLTEGLTHDLRNPPPGCCFQFRCPQVGENCRKIAPELTEIHPEHFVACHLCAQGRSERKR